MDIRRLGARSLTNLAYTYLASNLIQDRLSEAEETRANQPRSAPLTRKDREQVAERALADFDETLTMPLDSAAGEEADRLRRARANTDALRRLMEDMRMANDVPAP